MKKLSGFSLIELVLFIVVTSILSTVILLAFSSPLLKTSTDRQQIIAQQAAKQCMEWFIGQRQLNGFSSLTCPSTPSPSICTGPPGYTVSTSISCTTVNSDSSYMTIAVTVTGLGNAVLTTLIADY